MSDKTWCPACDSSTSSLNECFNNGEPCRYCGLSNSAWGEVLRVRRARDDDAMAEEFSRLRIDNDRLTRELDEVKRKFKGLKDRVEGALR
ncbi:hypothetical protein [Streptomyces microflavus]|uniref:hypothetical protein n=1 Tax=Streptomyces microflavus TaxID=1919 RepID=UPI00369F0799